MKNYKFGFFADSSTIADPKSIFFSNKIQQCSEAPAEASRNLTQRRSLAELHLKPNV